MKRGFKGKRRSNDPTYKPYDALFHPKNIIELMAAGMFNCQIEDVWYISHSTFCRWRNEYPELQEAYEIGESKRKAHKIKNYITPMLEGKLEGKHSFAALKYVMDAELNYSPTTLHTAGTTNISIENMNVLQQKSISELIEKLNADFTFLEQNNILQADYKVIESPNESSESN